MDVQWRLIPSVKRFGFSRGELPPRLLRPSVVIESVDLKHAFARITAVIEEIWTGDERRLSENEMNRTAIHLIVARKCTSRCSILHKCRNWQSMLSSERETSCSTTNGTRRLSEHSRSCVEQYYCEKLVCSKESFSVV
ncbi:hypothetical protein Y032_0186g1083 [Ancylostoma ceylanicum]|uniref:Uncharacterized protein n=1 Tax=Ancylostoma ceylanicum TaxID=53326 RepID=A0A016SRE3_9BILA|nr:hypothetical protein Y032_0186g1083 [Ancylostoma ceylanicum]